MRTPIAIGLVLLAGEAAAHSGCEGCFEPGSLLSEESLALVLVCVAAGLYANGIRRLWIRAGVGRGIRIWQAACFAAGCLLLLLPFATPLHDLAGRLFVAHMVEHELLILVAAPLVAVSRPFGAIVWGLPRRWRKATGALARSARLAAFAAWASRLGPATFLHGAAVWLWHVPAAYEAALASPGYHWLQHATLVGTAVLFWYAVLVRGLGCRQHGLALFGLFATALHTGFLGILLTAARTPLYPGQSGAAPDWGLTALEDQQLAGTIMWVPGGLAYAAAGLVVAALWIRASGFGAVQEGSSLAAAR
ncbi:MAG TPA: cytochrome c oxidase assembly protein [Afifellaceae bacterium]|nr:cytochrome c oxidase assembly protein [Afifellaceae bacterium]